jgi:hypothetical protein
MKIVPEAPNNLCPDKLGRLETAPAVPVRIGPVAVEKLARREIAEIASRQEALQTIFPNLLDIFYHPIFDFFQKNRPFQQPLLLPPAISDSDSIEITLRARPRFSALLPDE